MSEWQLRPNENLYRTNEKAKGSSATRKKHGLLQLPDVLDRAGIVVATVEEVVDEGADDDDQVHQQTPVECRDVRIGADGEEDQDEHDREDGNAHDVERQAELAEREFARQERLAHDALTSNQADGDEVRGKQRGGGDGADGVERDIAAQVDQGEKAGGDEGEDDRVHGNVPALGDLKARC